MYVQYRISVPTGFMVFRQAQGWWGHDRGCFMSERSSVRTEQICLGWWIHFRDCRELCRISVIYHLYCTCGDRYSMGWRVCTALWGRAFILDMCAWLNICLPLCSTCRCIDMVAKRPEVSQPALTLQSSIGSHISCLKGNSETMGCVVSSLHVGFEHSTSCTSP